MARRHDSSPWSTENEQPGRVCASGDSRAAGDPARRLQSKGWIAGLTAVLTMGMAVATIAQFAFGAMAPFIREDLEISRTQLGALTTALFIGGAVLSPVVGPLADRVGGRRILLSVFLVNVVAFSAMALAPTYLLLLAAVAVSGLAVAGSNPSTNLLIARHVPKGPRGAVVGVKQSGVQIGSFVAGAVFPTLAAVVGWRRVLFSVAVTAALGALATWRVIPPVPPGPRASRVAGPLMPAVRWLVPYAFFMGAGVAAITSYLVLYSHEAVGLSEPVAGTLLAAVGGVGVAARILWSHYAERTGALSVPLAVLAGLSLVSTVAVLAARFVGPWCLWLGAAGAGASAAAWNGVGMLAIIREARPGEAGRASGWVLTAFYVGLLLMPIGFGAIVDATGGYEWAWMLTAACFVAALLIGVVWTRQMQRLGAGSAPPGAERAQR